VPFGSFVNDPSGATGGATPAPFGRMAANAVVGGVGGPLQATSFSLDEKKNFDFMGGYDYRDLPQAQSLPEVAFIGRSNVGKSSMMNALSGSSGKGVAVVSKTPGRTRRINLFRVTTKKHDHGVCVFADLPGYGFAKLGKSMQKNISRSLRRYFDSRRQLQLAVLLVDVRREPQDADADLAAALEELDVPFVVLATKCDKLKPAERERNLAAIREGLDLPDNLPIPASVVNGDGVRLLWSIIQGVCADPVERDMSGAAEAAAAATDDDDDEFDDDDDEDFFGGDGEVMEALPWDPEEDGEPFGEDDDFDDGDEVMVL